MTTPPDQPMDDADELGPIYEDITELCDFCVELTTMMVENKVHSGTLRSLPEPKHCEFCKVFLVRLDEVRGSRSEGPEFLKSQRLCNSATYEREKDGRICEVFWFNSDFIPHHFALWADEDSIACTTLTGAPIVSPKMSHACNIAKHWLNTCKSHTKCLPEECNPLPSRVLEFYGDHTRPSLRLVDGRSIEGQYLALSHCWGSSKNRPLRTTRLNINKHETQIPFHDLPKTFQDFVQFAQGLGVKYIWIDSLCIIQDDREDWHSEAEKMGDVYRNAALVVAASGAKDSTEGLRVTDPPRTVVYRLPYRIGSVCEGTFNLTRLRHGWSSPADGVLNTRAWAFQERYLARRMVSFMPGGMSWHCKSIDLDEVGQKQEFFMDSAGWSQLLTSYSKKALTYSSDRLEALKGIVAQLQRSRTDRYDPKYGMWQDRLIPQLFWVHNGPQNDDGALDLPSWCWAATQSDKMWPEVSGLSKYVTILKAKELVEDEEITAAGCIQMFGPLGTTLSHARDAGANGPAGTWLRRILRSSFVTKRFPFVGFFERGWFLIESKVTVEVVDGFAHFDHEKRTSCTHHLLAFKANRIRSELTTHWLNKPDPERPPHDFDFIYWTLLLDQVGEGKYKRVGIGILFPSAYEALKVEYKEIGLV